MNEQESDDPSREENFLNLFRSQEIDAAEFMAKEHGDLVIGMPRNVLEFFDNSLNSIPKISNSEIFKSELVCHLILGRLVQDIRSMSICASLSYATGVASIAASIFEISFELMYLSGNEKGCTEWINHKLIKETSSKIGERVEAYVDKLGFKGREKEVWVQKYFAPYRLICMAKHGNSMLQQSLGLKVDETSGKAVIAAGPDGSPESMAIIALSLEHSLPVATAALARFFQEYHPSLAEGIVLRSDEIGVKLTLIGMRYPKLKF